LDLELLCLSTGGVEVELSAGADAEARALLARTALSSVGLVGDADTKLVDEVSSFADTSAIGHGATIADALAIVDGRTTAETIAIRIRLSVTYASTIRSGITTTDSQAV